MLTCIIFYLGSTIVQLRDNSDSTRNDPDRGGSSDPAKWIIS